MEDTEIKEENKETETNGLDFQDIQEAKEKVTTWLEKVLGTNWKTITGGTLMAASAVLELAHYKALAEIVMAFGMGLGVIGIGHKLQRM